MDGLDLLEIVGSMIHLLNKVGEQNYSPDPAACSLLLLFLTNNMLGCEALMLTITIR